MVSNTKTAIDPERWYHLSELARMGAFPWIRSNDQRTYARTVARDQQAQDILRTMNQGNGRGTRYKMKGENIIKFRDAVENGAYRL